MFIVCVWVCAHSCVVTMVILMCPRLQWLSHCIKFSFLPAFLQLHICLLPLLGKIPGIFRPNCELFGESCFRLSSWLCCKQSYYNFAHRLQVRNLVCVLISSHVAPCFYKLRTKWKQEAQHYPSSWMCLPLEWRHWFYCFVISPELFSISSVITRCNYAMPWPVAVVTISNVFACPCVKCFASLCVWGLWNQSIVHLWYSCGYVIL